MNSTLTKLAQAQPYPLIFATVSGAHLYGFPSPDSDFDLRGVHVLPPKELVGLIAGPDTIQDEGIRDGLEMDIVTQDAGKFFSMMLKRNGYVLEQLFSPLIVQTSPAHEELKAIGRECVTRHHAHHYLGFAETQWHLFEKENPRRVKPLLYVYRVVLTGIHLMRTGVIEANLLRLNEDFKLPYIQPLVDRKLAGPEQSTLSDTGFGFYFAEYQRLVQELEQAEQKSSLRTETSAKPALHDLLLRLRFA